MLKGDRDDGASEGDVERERSGQEGVIERDAATGPLQR